MQWIKMLLLAFAAIVAAAVVGEIPPFLEWFALVDAHQSSWLIATGGSAAIGITLMMGGILDLLMAQDLMLGHEEAEDVERSVRMAARPVTARSASYRVWGHATGQAGFDEFSFREMKQAWMNGAWRRKTVWRRRYLISVGALLMTIGAFGLGFTLGPPPIKVLTGGALLYAMGMITWGLWKA